MELLPEIKEANPKTIIAFKKCVKKINAALKEYYQPENEYMPIICIPKEELENKKCHRSWLETQENTLEISSLRQKVGITGFNSWGFF